MPPAAIESLLSNPVSVGSRHPSPKNDEGSLLESLESTGSVILYWSWTPSHRIAQGLGRKRSVKRRLIQAQAAVDLDGLAGEKTR